MTNLPNLFIPGAPKCGTTALAHWLAEHPHVYMSPQKEPHFFNTDHAHRNVFSWQAYQRLFRDADPDRHLSIGEASVWYLYSAEAINAIQRQIPDARFIVMLRNPVEMALALHEEMVFAGYEDQASFAEAWNAQTKRAEGDGIPGQCVEPSFLQYGAACALGSQMENLLQQVDHDQVLFLVMEDMRQDPASVYANVLSFLGLKHDGRNDFGVRNSAKVRRSQWLLRLSKLMSTIHRRFGVSPGLGLQRFLERVNTRYRSRPQGDTDNRAVLERFFAPEIRKMERLLERDLSHWLQHETRVTTANGPTG